MKLESCRAEMLRVCLSPAHMLRSGSVQATVVGLRSFGRRTHEDEWDEVRASCFATCMLFALVPADRRCMPAAVRFLLFLGYVHGFGRLQYRQQYVWLLAGT